MAKLILLRFFLQVFPKGDNLSLVPSFDATYVAFSRLSLGGLQSSYKVIKKYLALEYT
jgi:hypothetical protein